jgi:calcineurin-like phosphoesterase
VHQHCCVPTNPGAVSTFSFLITGKHWFVLGSNGVEVISGGNHRHTKVEFLRATKEGEHDVSTAFMSL